MEAYYGDYGSTQTVVEYESPYYEVEDEPEVETTNPLAFWLYPDWTGSPKICFWMNDPILPPGPPMIVDKIHTSKIPDVVIITTKKSNHLKIKSMIINSTKYFLILCKTDYNVSSTMKLLTRGKDPREGKEEYGDYEGEFSLKFTGQWGENKSREPAWIKHCDKMKRKYGVKR